MCEVCVVGRLSREGCRLWCSRFISTCLASKSETVLASLP